MLDKKLNTASRKDQDHFRKQVSQVIEQRKAKDSWDPSNLVCQLPHTDKIYMNATDSKGHHATLHIALDQEDYANLLAIAGSPGPFRSPADIARAAIFWYIPTALHLLDCSDLETMRVFQRADRTQAIEDMEDEYLNQQEEQIQEYISKKQSVKAANILYKLLNILGNVNERCRERINREIYPRFSYLLDV